MRNAARLMMLAGLAAVGCSKSGTDATAEATKAEAPRKKRAPARGASVQTPLPLPLLDTNRVLSIKMYHHPPSTPLADSATFD